MSLFLGSKSDHIRLYQIISAEPNQQDGWNIIMNDTDYKNNRDNDNHITSVMILYVACHYANMSVQYTAIFHGCKNVNFQMKIFDIFLTFAQKIDCGYTLEPPQRGGSNEYPQSMFWSKNKKNMYTRVNPTFSI